MVQNQPYTPFQPFNHTSYLLNYFLEDTQPCIIQRILGTVNQQIVRQIYVQASCITLKLVSTFLFSLTYGLTAI